MIAMVLVIMDDPFPCATKSPHGPMGVFLLLPLLDVIPGFPSEVVGLSLDLNRLSEKMDVKYGEQSEFYIMLDIRPLKRIGGGKRQILLIMFRPIFP